MTQMILSTKQKQTHRHRERICGCKGVGEEKTGSLGLADAIICRMDKQQGPMCRIGNCRSRTGWKESPGHLLLCLHISLLCACLSLCPNVCFLRTPVILDWGPP